jgi:hypothetical protein
MILLATSALIATLGLSLFAVGLDDADKYASVIGALSAMAGLGLSLSTLIGRPAPAVPAPDESGLAAGQRIHASTIGGDAVQIREVSGNVRMGPCADSGRPARAAARGTRPKTSPGGQSVINAQVGGSSAQIDRVAGDVDIERSP